MTTAMREVRLPDELCAAVEQRFGQQFATIEEFLVFVLMELVRDKARQLDQSDQRMIEARLRDLGYI
jgi:hypothetical protein